MGSDMRWLQPACTSLRLRRSSRLSSPIRPATCVPSGLAECGWSMSYDPSPLSRATAVLLAVAGLPARAAVHAQHCTPQLPAAIQQLHDEPAERAPRTRLRGPARPAPPRRHAGRVEAWPEGPSSAQCLVGCSAHHQRRRRQRRVGDARAERQQHARARDPAWAACPPLGLVGHLPGARKGPLGRRLRPVQCLGGCSTRRRRHHPPRRRGARRGRRAGLGRADGLACRQKRRERRQTPPSVRPHRRVPHPTAARTAHVRRALSGAREHHPPSCAHTSLRPASCAS